MNTEDRMPFAFEKSPKDKSKNIIKVRNLLQIAFEHET